MAPPDKAHVIRVLPAGTKLQTIYEELKDTLIQGVAIELDNAAKREFYYDNLVRAFHRKARIFNFLEFRTDGNTRVLFTRKE